MKFKNRPFSKTSLELYEKYGKIIHLFLFILTFLDSKITFIKMVKYEIKKQCIFV